MDVEDDSETEGLAPRQPSVQDVIGLCRELNRHGAKYLVVGGFAMIELGYDRRTMDVELLIDTSPENEARVYKALESLPDKAVKDLDRGDVEKFTVVRVCDEIVVDLMKAACGIDFSEALPEIAPREIDGVKIPFASARLLWRMKKPTHREKDASDLLFLGEWFKARGQEPPNV